MGHRGSCFGSSLLSLHTILFHVDLPFLLYLVFLVGFYFILSFTICFSVISFVLNCGFFSAGYRVVVPLASDVCPLEGEVNPGTCVGFLDGAPSACPLVSGVRSHPLLGIAMSRGVF